MKRIARILCLVIAIIMVFSACEKQKDDGTIIEVDPTQGAANKEKAPTLLYFAFSDYTMLIGEQRLVSASVNERAEYAILQALISGPQQNTASFKQLINPKTRVVSVKESKDVVTVTLSKEFLLWDDIGQSIHVSDPEKEKLKQLAVYSIVNTLVENSGYAKVQILVDREDTGKGQRLQRSEVGFEGEEILEPMEHNGQVCRTAKYVLEQSLILYKNKDYAALFAMVSFEEGQMMEESAFVASLEEKNSALSAFEVQETLENTSTDKCIMTVAITTVKNEVSTAKNSVPFTLVKENGIWKLSQSAVLLLTN